MKAYEFREMTEEELDRKIRDLREDLFRTRFSAGRAAEANPAERTKIRRDIARAKTVLRERELRGEDT